MNRYFVTAIGTDSGKSLVSAILTEALEADYWKPVQAGFPTDTDFMKVMVSNKKTVFHKETHLLKLPMSPHAAAEKEGIEIQLNDFIIPKTNNHLVIEGAGGMMVPINNEDFVMDLAKQLKAKIILVSNLYLGSINHTILSIKELKRYNVEVEGIIFNGKSNPDSEKFILNYSSYKCLLRIPELDNVDKKAIKKYADELRKNLNS